MSVNPIKNWWCQKVIPLVYDDSITVIEMVGKLVDKTNELISFINDVLEQKLNEYILSMFNKLMINATYEESTETIYLFLDKSGGEKK